MTSLIRRATDRDLETLVRMSVALFPSASAEEHERDIRTIIAREDATHFVAEREDGTLCGFLEIGTRPYADGCESSPVGYIEAWYVDPDMRRSGIGRALLEAAERWARDRGLTEIASDTQIDNDVSFAAHIRSGYAEMDRIVQFRKRL